MQWVRRARRLPVLVAVCCAAGVAAQDSFVPAQYADGALPQIPIGAVGGGEVFLEVAVSGGGTVITVTTLREVPPFADALSHVVREWRFVPAEAESPAAPGPAVVPRPRQTVDSKVLVAGMFRPPSISTPTLAQPPQDVSPPSDETPFPVATVMPPFPPLARESGVVLVEMRVDTRGDVVDAWVIHSAPPFDGPSIDAAQQWRFRPARVRGVAVESLAYVVFAFRQPVTQAPPAGP